MLPWNLRAAIRARADAGATLFIGRTATLAAASFGSAATVITAASPGATQMCPRTATPEPGRATELARSGDIARLPPSWAALTGQAITHLHDASVETLRPMKALGVGWTVQDTLYFSGEQFRRQHGEAAARRAPPVEPARSIGVVIGLGTDGLRSVPSYNPFTALQWLLDGKALDGLVLRGPEETPSRNDALRFYTGAATLERRPSIRKTNELGSFDLVAAMA
jgi:hypothetical protein